jgi:hypothetical protein
MANAGMDPDWRDVYREALFEPDSEKVLIRIDTANQAIRCRVCGIWQLGRADGQERSQLDAASYFLGLLRTITGKKKSPQIPVSSGAVPEKQAS